MSELDRELFAQSGIFRDLDDDALEAVGPDERWPNKVEIVLCQERKRIQQERAERVAAEERKKGQEKKRISEQEFQTILKEKGLR